MLLGDVELVDRVHQVPPASVMSLPTPAGVGLPSLTRPTFTTTAWTDDYVFRRELVAVFTVCFADVVVVTTDFSHVRLMCVFAYIAAQGADVDANEDVEPNQVVQWVEDDESQF